MDWNKIKAEYIAGGTSYRKLAEKHGVTFAVLRRVAESEGWVELKAQAKHKANTKIVNSVATDMAKKSVKLNDVADKLLDKISELLDNFELDTQGIKHLTSAIKDIKDIKGIKSEIDLKEQNARIDKLRKDVGADKGDDEKPYGVVLMPPIMPDVVPPSEGDANGQ